MRSLTFFSMLTFFFNAFQSAPRNGIDKSLRSGLSRALMNNSVMIPMASVLVLLEILVSPINFSNDGKFPNGLVCTNNAPALARSFDVPLCNAISNHFESVGFSRRKLQLTFGQQIRGRQFYCSAILPAHSQNMFYTCLTVR